MYSNFFLDSAYKVVNTLLKEGNCMNNDLKFRKFEETCRKYLFEKEVMKELEARYVRYNTQNTHYNDHVQRMDSLKRYRLIEAHVRHVDHVMKEVEKQYGKTIAEELRERLVNSCSMENRDVLEEMYRQPLMEVLNGGGKHEKFSV